MTQKKFILNNCLECPAMEAQVKGQFCGLSDEPHEIEDVSTFPKWCPLEDA